MVMMAREEKRMRSKQTSVAASSIKNKMLNTSSFFKVSLKNNNKALALALAAEKERRRQLEMQTVYLQKQVEAMCFQLATGRHKQRRMLFILKSLHSDALHHFDMMAEVFSSENDGPELSEDNTRLSTDTDAACLQRGRPTNRSAQHKGSSDLLSSMTSSGMDLSGRNVCTDSFKGHTDDQRRPSMQDVQTSRQSLTLRDEMGKLSPTSFPGLQNRHTASASGSSEKPSGDSVMAADPVHCKSQDKTMLLNTSMDMTVTTATDIVTVDTNTTGHTGKPGNPKVKHKKQVPERSVAESVQLRTSTGCDLTEVQRVPSTKQDVRDTEGSDVHSPVVPTRAHVTCRIPKLIKHGAGSHDKSMSDISKSGKTDHEDYFMDPKNHLSKSKDGVPLPAETCVPEERLTVNRRTSKTKGRKTVSKTIRDVSKKSLLTANDLPSHECESKLDFVFSEMEKGLMEGWKASEDQERRGEPLLSEGDEVTHPESGLETRLSTSSKPLSKTGKRLSRCRRTFVVSVVRDGPSSTRAASENEARPAEEPSAGDEASVAEQYSEINPHQKIDGGFVEETRSSCKRPWEVTQDRGGVPEDCGNNQSNVPLNQGCDTKIQNPKKARREDTAHSRRNKDVRRTECTDLLHRKGKKNVCSNKGFESENGAPDLQDRGHAAPLCGTASLDGTKTNEQSRASQGAETGEKDEVTKHLFISKPPSSKPRMELNQHRERSKLHAPTLSAKTPDSSRQVRETFVVWRQKSQDCVSLGTHATMADGAAGYSHESDPSNETLHQKVGDLLMEEMPPWMALDVSSANTTVNGFPSSPKSLKADTTAEFIRAEPSPARRTLTSLPGSPPTSSGSPAGRVRRRKAVVSYKEPSLSCKMRRGDKFTDSMFLSSPVFKDGRKKRQKKHVPAPTDPSSSDSLQFL